MLLKISCKDIGLLTDMGTERGVTPVSGPEQRCHAIRRVTRVALRGVPNAGPGGSEQRWHGAGGLPVHPVLAVA
jgi:hypothetical protein